GVRVAGRAGRRRGGGPGRCRLPAAERPAGIWPVASVAESEKEPTSPPPLLVAVVDPMACATSLYSFSVAWPPPPHEARAAKGTRRNRLFDFMPDGRSKAGASSAAPVVSGG